VYGLVIDPGSAANFVPLNGADNWLHLGLGVVMLAAGLIAARDGPHRTTPRRPGPLRRPPDDYEGFSRTFGEAAQV
jgi:hypothetical protein